MVITSVLKAVDLEPLPPLPLPMPVISLVAIAPTKLEAPYRFQNPGYHASLWQPSRLWRTQSCSFTHSLFFCVFTCGTTVRLWSRPVGALSDSAQTLLESNVSSFHRRRRRRRHLFGFLIGFVFCLKSRRFFNRRFGRGATSLWP